MRAAAVAVGAGVLAVAAPVGVASAATTPDLVTLLSGFGQYWQAGAAGGYAGTVVDADVLAHNDEMVVWINNNASAAQQFTALQTAQLGGTPPTGYNEAITLAPALGSVLSPLYVQGLTSGDLDLVATALEAAEVSTGTAKSTYDYPRPYLASDPSAPPADDPCTDPADNGASLQANRVGRPYADADGNLDITLVPDAVDSTDQYVDVDVSLSADYSGLCKEASFPSGHTTAAYQYGVTLATLLPELGPEILGRASEMGINRNILGVHYPLDVMGGRIGGTAGVAAQWADETVAASTYTPARQQLVAYLQAECGATLQICIAQGMPYQDDPFDGQAVPGGTAQVVTNRASAVEVFQERMTYGFPQSGTTGLDPSVPAGAEKLLLTTFPDLTDAQRRSVLAQTEIASGYPLDLSGQGDGGSWQRLDLAAAMSATVQLQDDTSVTVLSTGGQAVVVPAPVAPPTVTVTASTTVTETTSTTLTETVPTTVTAFVPTTVTTTVPTTLTQTVAGADASVTRTVQVASADSRDGWGGSGGYGQNVPSHAGYAAAGVDSGVDGTGHPTSGALASTGANVIPFTVVAFLALLTGATLILAGRRGRDRMDEVR